MTDQTSATQSSEIHLIRLAKTYQMGQQTRHLALDQASLWVRRGETISIVGPTGCGKSTLLRVIAGLETPDAGTVTFDGEDVAALTPAQRGIGLVFQNYALYPHFKVHGNIAFYFRLRRWSAREIDAKVQDTARIMGIGFDKLLGRLPRSLSGGEKQRVALARCLSHSPRVLLLDEPFSNLDATLRLRTRSEVKKLIERFGLTTVFVTHDQNEAVAMGHRLAVMRAGRLAQVGTYQELYQAPVDMFVAGFLGNPPMNFFTGQRRGETVLCDLGGATLCVPFPAPYQHRVPEAAVVTIGVRPEHWRVTHAAATSSLPCTVDYVETALSETAHLLHLTCGTSTLCAKVELPQAVRPQQTVWLQLPPQALYYFDQQEQRL